ncbi:helix-turn-helix transcriptional regulator [Homoserinibacter sp. GY 40078]|nr:helix-turn-helix transcriptional regulator [Homoserinibacter sp. GY 40078]
MSPVARDALVVLGQQIRVARIERSWTVGELADRALSSPPTIRAIETGAPGTSIGTVFQVAFLVGVPLFNTESRAELARLRREGASTLALLPERVRHRDEQLDDRF